MLIRLPRDCGLIYFGPDFSCDVSHSFSFGLGRRKHAREGEIGFHFTFSISWEWLPELKWFPTHYLSPYYDNPRAIRSDAWTGREMELCGFYWPPWFDCRLIN